MKRFFPSCLAALMVVGLTSSSLQAEDVLFIGNSFDFGGSVREVKDHGGIPKIIEAIATAKGKPVSVLMVATGGKGFDFHLKNPAADAGLKTKPWDFVSIHEYSSKPTHAGDVAGFMKDGEAFYDKIIEADPKATVVLYETWAYAPKHPIYASADPRHHLANPDEMYQELHTNYAALQAALQARDPKRPVLISPVGTAFHQCIQEHPEIELYVADSRHPSKEGAYLSALVQYATLFKDSPVGAITQLPGYTVDDATAQKLQAVAAEVTQK